MAETPQKSFHSPRKAHKPSPSTPIIPQTPQTVTPSRSSRQVSSLDPSDLRRSSRRSSLQFLEPEKRSSKATKYVKKGERSKLPVTPDVSEARKRKSPDEGNVVTRARVSRNAGLMRKKRVYYKKVVYDGGEFAVGDDVYVKRRENASSDDEELQVEECRVCFKSGRAVMIECDDCLGGFHLKCLKPPLKEVPEGDWICQFCEARKLGKEVVLPKPPKGKKRKRTAREKLLSSDLWTAHIENIWKEVDGTYWFRGRWYIIPEETAAGRQSHNLRRELYRTNDFADIEMESVIRLCYVMSPKEFTKANNEGDDIFLCEYEYDIHWHGFKRLAEIDNGEEGNEEADNDVDWDYGKDSGSDTEEDMEYEEENVNNLPSGPSPAHAVAAVWTLYILFISVAFSLVVA